MIAQADEARVNEIEELKQTWSPPKGWLGALSEVDHKVIGQRYVVTAILFLILGGIEALLMRLQLAVPENRLLNPDLYNQIFTTHGSTMMFLFAVPIMEGIGLLLVPLQIGTRNVAFPRLNALGYYLYLIGGLFLYWGLFTNTGPDAGWFAYTPLSGPQFTPGKRMDVWAQMITFTEISALIGAVEIIVTVAKMRAPGMSLKRMPLFTWAMFIQSWMVLFAMPAIVVSSSMLLLDRSIGTHFLNPAEGGDPLMWQHIFWFFGHPEVYIIFVPALGMTSTLIGTFTRRKVFGYTALVASMAATAILGFTLWVHHMFTTGIPFRSESFFTAASMLIAIPSGVQIFCWLATIWAGKPKFDVPFGFVIAFFLTFVMGGLTGVMISSVPFNHQVHDTFFIVAHFHYVLIGGAVFPLLGAIYYWFPKFRGTIPNAKVGWASLALVFLGFHLTFFPMHQLGLRGMPRRVYTYKPETGWGPLNMLATVGAFLIASGGFLYLGNLARARKRAESGNPWGAGELEWSIPCPAPPYAYAYLPVVESRTPVWDGNIPEVHGLRTDRREVLVTNPFEAKPEYRYVLPNPSIWPFLTASSTALGLIGSVFNMWWFVIGAAATLLPFIGWFWPRMDRRFIPAKEAAK